MNPALVTFATELLRWNARINLTAATTPADAVQHINDCLSILAYIPADTKRLVDVGSGGGLPAAVIAIERPEVAVVALEPVHKKLAFLQHVRRTLAPNLVALPERVEQHEHHDYDIATSRATFALPEWLAIGATLVRPGGLVLGMEGAEQIELPAGATRHVYELGDRTRAIIVFAPPASR
jgi:16S rRNA (guanine527-N7)-methyltransferase